MHKTSATSLVGLYACVIVYASLFPFEGWRDQGISPLAFVTAPWPHYWSGFDIATNVVGYVPFGFLLALSQMRGRLQRSSLAALWVSAGVAAAVSLLMEMGQTYLPQRVPSNVDWGLNSAGALFGAWLAAALEGAGVLGRWSRFRRDWFVDEAHVALVLLLLWPVAVLYPAPVPLGLGHVADRFWPLWVQWADQTRFAQWLPEQPLAVRPLAPATVAISVFLGAVIPGLLINAITWRTGRRLLLGWTAVGLGALLQGLSAAMSWGPMNAWAWLDLPAAIGLLGAALLAPVLALWPRLTCAAMALLALPVYLMLVNQAPTTAYFTHTLQSWEQGRFIRFHGLAQWVGWLWPYALALHLVLRISVRWTSDGGKPARR